MFSHLTVGYNDRAGSEAFYAATMPGLGLPLQSTSPHYIAYGPAPETPPWLFVLNPFDGKPATCGNGFHIAFAAESRDVVDRFHEQALAAGGTDEGAPGLRPRYSADYYGAYVRDPAGNKLQAVCYLDGRTAGDIGGIVSHITLGADDLDRGLSFYEPVFSELGYKRLRNEETPGEDLAFGTPGRQLPVTFVQHPFDGRPASRGNGQHAAFVAESRDAVDRFHAAALRLGGVDAGAPGLRPDYHASYYAAYVFDPAGNKLQAVCHKPVS